MSATVVQLNISRGGVPKLPIPEAVVNRLGIEGDEHAHPRFHGGPKKAVLLIGEEAIAEIQAAGYAIYAGALGENVTTRGLDRRMMRSGQRYRIGEVIVELTAVRQPCDTLTQYGPGIQQAIFDARVKAGDTTSPHWALSGFYAAVLMPGRIRPRDPIELLEEIA